MIMSINAGVQAPYKIINSMFLPLVKITIQDMISVPPSSLLSVLPQSRKVKMESSKQILYTLLTFQCKHGFYTKMLEFLSNLYSNNLCSIIRIYELYEISKYIAIQKNRRNQIVQLLHLIFFILIFSQSFQQKQKRRKEKR